MTPKEKQKNNRLYKTYGLTLHEWEEKLKSQGNKCFICKREFTGRVNTDHIHIKGYKTFSPEQKKKYVRALLCFMCNKGLGAIERNKEPRRILQAFVQYATIYKLRNDLDL